MSWVLFCCIILIVFTMARQPGKYYHNGESQKYVLGNAKKYAKECQIMGKVKKCVRECQKMCGKMSKKCAGECQNMGKVKKMCWGMSKNEECQKNLRTSKWRINVKDNFVRRHTNSLLGAVYLIRIYVSRLEKICSHGSSCTRFLYLKIRYYYLTLKSQDKNDLKIRYYYLTLKSQDKNDLLIKKLRTC